MAVLQISVKFCLTLQKMQKIAEITPVHLWMTPTWHELF